ncbi:unnamed protein product [Bemisia tabaci]|uniref:UDP-glucuronosyltransferase n=1 Tax=Bemisia tabaci TaxID=7038 RepID=A0A9P0AQR1_BEMTA|nr:unnamed protein product [Bemisia tabaci]
MIFRIISHILVLAATGDAYKILVLFPIASYSHQRPILPLIERLVQDGHEVFVINPNRVPGLENHANYTHVDTSFTYEFLKDPKKEGFIDFQQKLTKWKMTQQFELWANTITKILRSENFLNFKQRVESENIQFDVAIQDTWDTPYFCAIVRLLTRSAPIISLATVSVDPLVEPLLGTPYHLSFTPSLFDPYTDKMTLWQRLENWFSHHYIVQRLMGTMEEVARRHFRDQFGRDSESLVEGCCSNISLNLIASNSLYFYPRLLGPNVIELGPLHLKPPKALPKNLLDWMDGAEEGIIYFSLGSNMKSKALPENVRGNLLRFFRELPPGYRVLWKWELDGKIPGQSDNILPQQWLPQDSILAHPKIRLFVTQGGLQSFQEAVHFGVPMVGIPWIVDQFCQVAKIVDAQIGVQLNPEDLHSFERIKEAFETILHDKSYARNVKKLSAISHDFTSQSMDKAVFWIQHVARHKGAAHLRPATADSTLFEYLCLDILSVILIFSSGILIVIYAACTFLISKYVQKVSIKLKRS